MLTAPDPVGAGAVDGLAAPADVRGAARACGVACGGACPGDRAPGNSRYAPSPARTSTVTTNASRRWPRVSSMTGPATSSAGQDEARTDPPGRSRPPLTAPFQQIPDLPQPPGPARTARTRAAEPGPPSPRCRISAVPDRSSRRYLTTSGQDRGGPRRHRLATRRACPGQGRAEPGRRRARIQVWPRARRVCESPRRTALARCQQARASADRRGDSQTLLARGHTWILARRRPGSARPWPGHARLVARQCRRRPPRSWPEVVR